MNASNREADFAWLKEREISGSEVRDVSDEYALLAVQGPNSIARLGLRAARRELVREGDDRRVQCMVNRTGYTGEEASSSCAWPRSAGASGTRCSRAASRRAASARATRFVSRSCYPLHGNDISPETDAISAGLGWTCALEKDFTGADELRRIKEEGPERKLVAFVMEEQGDPAAGHADRGGGEVTSGHALADARLGIGMGYVPAAQAAAGTELTIDVRGRTRAARAS